MELIRKQVRMNQMGKTVTDQFMIGGDYNVPDAKSDVGRVLSGEGSLRIEETRRVENYLRVTGKLNFKVLYVTDSGDPRPGALEGMIPFEEMVYMEEENGEGEDIVQVQRVECGVSLIHSRKLAVKALAKRTELIPPQKRINGKCLMPVSLRRPSSSLLMNAESVRLSWVFSMR